MTRGPPWSPTVLLPLLCALGLGPQLLRDASAAPAAELPPILQRAPLLSDYDWAERLPGVVPNVDELKIKPRVVLGYLSEKDWAFVEFLAFMHASWRYVTSMAQPTGHRLDLMIFADPRWLREAASVCQLLHLGPAPWGHPAAPAVEQLRRAGSESTCFVVPYPRPPASVWRGYPFLASFHFLADDRVGELLAAVYGYAMKTDLDCFLTAAIIQHFPQQFETGYMHYTPLPATPLRIRSVAAELGLRHAGRHDISPTWYGDVRTVVAVGNASIPLLYHLLDEHFERNGDGGWRANWATGEGWPLWSKDIAAMYAADLAINHLLDSFEVSKRYDVHGDSERYTFTLYHIHCQHGDGNFSKFEFFKHKYADRDISSGLDFNSVRDYALWLAASTWRHVAGRQGSAGAGAGDTGGAGGMGGAGAAVERRGVAGEL